MQNAPRIHDKAVGSGATAPQLPAPSGRWHVPREFERYTLLKRLPRGGMGNLFLATSRGIEGAERPCVVKVIRDEYTKDTSFRARFLDEARIQAQLRHPGVAQIFEASTTATDMPFVVMEYVEGRNLGEVQGRTKQLGLNIKWPEAVAMVLAVSDALAHVHERTDVDGKPLNIAHRDLSPQNVMVGYDGDVKKLIDFGTARGDNRRCRTVAGVVFAKPGYTAPEVANNCPGGVPADLYALGIMLWELIAGRRFLTGEASAHLAAVGMGQLRPEPLASSLGIPTSLDRVIERLTATRIEDRYESSRQVTQVLLAILRRAPSLAHGHRSVRGRVGQWMLRLYPNEPAGSRSEFARLLQEVQHSGVGLRRETPPTRSRGATLASLAGVLPGTRYRLRRQLSQGTMAVVFEAEHMDLGRRVALKILPATMGRADAETRFRAEARVMASLSHDNLVKLHDFGLSTDGRFFYAMELLQGDSLEAVLRRDQRVASASAVKIGIQVCGALEKVHHAGIIHGDIKPANLFLTEAGRVKLLDFGVSGPHGVSEAADPSGMSLVGTPEYMAPEQLSGHSLDAPSDIYALGVVLYELVTGVLPHNSSTMATLIDAKLNRRAEPPSRLGAHMGIPAYLDRMILKCLEKEPRDRYQTAEQLRYALEDADLKLKQRAAGRGGFYQTVLSLFTPENSRQ